MAADSSAACSASMDGVEWTGRQQIFLLLQSAGLGLLLGVLFDMLGGLQPLLRRHRVVRWCLDILFGILAALITFYGALGLMDGRMHPLLFGGILIGALAEHLGGGRWIRRLVFRLCRFLHRAGRAVLRWMESFLLFFGAIFRKKRTIQDTKEKIDKKTRKKFVFFSKKA